MIIVVVCFILLQSISLSFAYSLFFFIPFLYARNEHFIRTIELKNSISLGTEMSIEFSLLLFVFCESSSSKHPKILNASILIIKCVIIFFISICKSFYYLKHTHIYTAIIQLILKAYPFLVTRY